MIPWGKRGANYCLGISSPTPTSKKICTLAISWWGRAQTVWGQIA